MTPMRMLPFNSILYILILGQHMQGVKPALRDFAEVFHMQDFSYMKLKLRQNVVHDKKAFVRQYPDPSIDTLSLTYGSRPLKQTRKVVVFCIFQCDCVILTK